MRWLCISISSPQKTKFINFQCIFIFICTYTSLQTVMIVFLSFLHLESYLISSCCFFKLNVTYFVICSYILESYHGFGCRAWLCILSTQLQTYSGIVRYDIASQLVWVSESTKYTLAPIDATTGFCIIDSLLQLNKLVHLL